MSRVRSQALLTGLLTRHLLHTMSRQRARAVVLWAALALALGIGVGLLAFMTSIEDSFRERGEAVGGISDLQVEAVSGSSLPAGLPQRLRRTGIRYAVPMTQQRVSLEAGRRDVVATAIGIDRSARKLRSAVQRDLKVPAGRKERPGLTLPTGLADELGVGPGERLRIFAYRRAPELRVDRVVETSAAIADVLTLPRVWLERLRGEPGRPTTLYVKLAPGVSAASWERRAAPLLPANALVTTAAGNQQELSHVLDFTVRAPTFVFGMVVLAIAALLIYVLQLMRMLERQEDLGLLRALGSRRLPLIAAESLILCVLLLAAIPPGLLIGTPIARYLASQVPTYLTDVFGFNMQVAVQPGVVLAAAGLALVVGIAATVGALASARGSISDQLGRSPQAGATVTSAISTRTALALLAGGGACLALGLLLADAGIFPLAAVIVLIGLALVTPGVVGLVAALLGRREHGGSKVAMVARGAVEANPRRAALAAAIMALGVAAVVPPQLAEHALLERIDRLNEAIRPGAQDLLASDDAFASVPVDLAYGRRAVRGEDTVSRAVAFAFVPYQGRKIEVRGLVPTTRGGLIRPGEGLPEHYRSLREHPRGVLISKVMAVGLDLETGDVLRLPTARGPRPLRVLGEVEDFAWPTGTVYMRLDRYRQLYRTEAVSALAVDRASKLDRERLREMAPLHAITGAEFKDRINAQMEKSTQGLLAMRALTLIAALVAVAGIIATSVFARRREWAVLRAMGIGNAGLLGALALETLLVTSIGALCGAIGGVVSYRGPTLGFLEAQGYAIGTELALGSVVAVTVAAVAIGALAAAIPAWLTARAPLAEALSYE
jgi:ABC-type lipoprotein release transport system permease subunit